jgi:hypothetical protein
MSEAEKSADARPSSEGENEPGVPGQPAKPIHTIIGAVFLIACIAVCGNFFGWFSGKGNGLGISREKVVQPLSQNGLGFQPGADQRGFPTEEATTLDGRSTIRLVGPKDDLVYVSITSSIDNKTTNTQGTLILLYQVTLLRTMFPEWTTEDVSRWLTESIDRMVKDPSVGQIEQRRGTALVKMSLSRSPLTLSVSVESGKW